MSVEVRETVGERIRNRREALGLSQRDVEGPGVSFAYISRIENDQRRPSVKALRRLAEKLRVSVHWLETGELDPGEVAMEAGQVLVGRGFIHALGWESALEEARRNLVAEMDAIYTDGREEAPHGTTEDGEGPTGG